MAQLLIIVETVVGLRDADSSRDDVFGQFGVLRDDYRPKAAFDVIRRMAGPEA
jgi:hypothetical protein